MRIIIAILILSIGVFSTSCEDLLEVPDISEESVALLAPSDSTIVLQNNVNFTWNEVFEATQYHIQVAAPSFDNATQIVVDTLIVIDSAYAGPNLKRLLEDSTYEWRVKAMNSDYETEFSINQFSVNTSGN